MNKVVYNGCYGGFSLSREAVLLGRQLSGDPNWGGPCIPGDVYANGQAVKMDYGHCYKLERHDPILIQVVETLGKAASGNCALLKVTSIPIGVPYRIDEYDGNESVETPDSYDWIIID